MTSSEDLQAAVNSAMRASSPDQVVSGVKGLVSTEIGSLDPSVEIEYTDYFNHTYMPDMVMSWPRSQVARPLYIRNSLRLASTLSEVRGLENREPVVMGMRSPGVEVQEVVRESARSSKRVLVTDIGSIDSFGRAASGGKSESASPLFEVLKSNILRSGRGFMGLSDVQELSGAAQRVVSTDPGESAAGMQDLARVASNLYAEDGVVQVTRIGRILQSASSPELLDEMLNTEGRLSDSDLRVILPYLLERRDIPASSKLWSVLARLVRLEDLENVAELEDADLTRLLIAGGVYNWTALRAELVINSFFEEGSEIGPETIWTIRGGKLQATHGPWNVVFASADKRKLRGASDALLANWDDISSAVRTMIVESASLRGIVRRLTISAEESNNVANDIAEVTSTLDDSYRVQSLDVRLPGRLNDDDETTVEVDFKKQLATAVGSAIPLDELGTIALRLLGHRFPVQPAWLR